jgi:tRNA(adenine34) deaminase
MIPTEERIVRFCEPFMTEAIRLAGQSAASDEVPIGAVVIRSRELMRLTDAAWNQSGAAAAPALHDAVSDTIIGRGRDRKVELTDPTAHAEILALREAAAHIGDWRLEECALIVTLEPCPMCAGAALLSRIPLVVYGARNPKFGAVETQIGLLKHEGWNHKVRTLGGCLEQECAQVLQDYFRGKRQPERG